MQLLSFTGVKEREWVLESVILYMKVAARPRNQCWEMETCFTSNSKSASPHTWHLLLGVARA